MTYYISLTINLYPPIIHQKNKHFFKGSKNKYNKIIMLIKQKKIELRWLTSSNTNEARQYLSIGRTPDYESTYRQIREIQSTKVFTFDGK